MQKILSAVAMLLLAPLVVQADAYKWVDRNGSVHYGDRPPANVRATPVDMKSAGPSRAVQLPVTPAVEQTPQPPAHAPIQISIAPEPAPQRSTRGMDFSVYIMLRAGMSEGELLQRAGPPDFQTYDGTVGVSVVGKAGRVNDPAGNTLRGSRVTSFNNLEVRRYYYYPTLSNPFTTVLTLTGGMISDLQRTRRF
ncbi:MAG TPA: DUF4124 domain-containing protein [Burkholderiales bacterium]|jgi:hypothetical protein|nr:DUF4124 domain-containing protein [Burkholderiales bacterium]